MPVLRPILLLGLCVLPFVGAAQSRLPSMPGHADYERHRGRPAALLQGGEPAVRWLDASRLAYRDHEGWVVVDAAKNELARVAEEPPRDPAGATGPRRPGPGRGMQATEVAAPDGKAKAVYRDGNVYLQVEGEPERAVTTTGGGTLRVKYGSASWVYGEELGQNEAMGFSPDGRRLWFYRFDERPVRDYYVLTNQRSPESRVMAMAYPKAGDPNPIADLLVYDRASGETRRVAVRPGPFGDGIGHYVYGIAWDPAGDALLFHRTDRLQKTLEYCRWEAASGRTTVLWRETRPESWVENRFPIVFLDQDPEIASAPEFQGQALWMSEQSGFINVYRLDLQGGGLTPVTRFAHDVGRIVRLDLPKREVWVTAGGGTNPYFRQLWRVPLGGGEPVLLTDPAYHHTVNLSPDARWIVDVAERMDTPPATRLLDRDGQVVRTLAETDLKAFLEAGYRLPERIEFVAADGVTPLVGRVTFPPGYDPSRTYPMLVSTYGGPLPPSGDSGVESFRPPADLAAFGFILAEFQNRGANGRGKAFRDAIYGRMGIAEVDDQAAGVRAVKSKYGVGQVGIYGTSYGGYVTVMAMLRYPDLFQAGVANSIVSDWRNYDTIYTERYMGLPAVNSAAYDAGSALTLAANLRGWLMVYYGSSDENTHPSNALQLVDALQRAGRSFEVQVGPDRGHTSVDWRRMMEFFLERIGAPAR